MNSFLFKHDTGFITTDNLRKTLQGLGADQCDVLYIHSGMQFGLPNLQLGRSGVLETLANILYVLDVPTLIMPSYTFSFCNAETFDQENTPSSMGALNEYLRVKHRWMRSRDPLMSNILHGEERGLITTIGKQSVGEGSTFDLLSRANLKVKFLFLGPRIHECFTYMHYLEAIRAVPYRYNFKFKGTIIENERKYEDEYTLFIRDEEVKAGSGAKIYENMMVERNIAGFKNLGGGSVTVVDLASARSLYFDLLALSPSFYIEEVYTKPIRKQSFVPRKMVAL